jgi:hypothetical protein
VTEGKKDDAGKLRFSLLPVEALAELVRVLEFGAKMYGVDNWKRLENGRLRFWDATQRHLWK